MGPFLPGYTRIILAGLSLHFMGYHPKYCTLLYSVSCLLDAVDGHAARVLGQTSKFGAVLDMVTDRSVLILALERFTNIIFVQMYNLLPTLLSLFSLSIIRYSVSISHYSRLQQSLHAYV